MAGRRAARTPSLPLFAAAAPHPAPLPPASQPGAGPEHQARRFLVLHGAGIGRHAVWALRFSPLVGRRGPDGLLIETTGLVEPEPGLLARVLGGFARAGHPCRGLLGSAPAALAALLRAGQDSAVLAPAQERAAVTTLPTAALDLPEEMITGLHRLGLRDVAALEAQPRGPLARRFGTALMAEMAALRGALAPFTPVRPPPEHVAAREFLEPLLTAPALERALGHLVAALCTGLDAAGAGARVLRLTAFRGDGTWQEIGQGLGRASRDPAHLMTLLGRQIERLRPEFGFERMMLAAPITERLGAAQSGLPGEALPEEALANLLDRLGQRLELWRPLPQASHWPERAQARGDAHKPGAPFAPAPRPLRLLRRPVPLEAISLLPDAPPTLLRRGRKAERVVRAEGPERIEPEWWRAGRQPPPRDYYQVELASGARWWVCRRGAPGEPDTKWFLHGYLC
jgi:protein ImuB